MGLQVVVITETKFLSKDDKPEYAYLDVEWLYPFDDYWPSVTEGFYKYKDRKTFITNISHSYYDKHREKLAQLLGWQSMNHLCWQGNKEATPFFEFMYFNCIEGSYDWLTSSKLSYEFHTWYDFALTTKNKKFIEWYDQMMAAFKHAADNNGAVLYL